ncbi:MAG: SEC-C domain-containing protein, partial [Anaeroplasma sp.]|nr:SEC-C domain-containing protein [Anaeroplasma sp.]
KIANDDFDQRINFIRDILEKAIPEEIKKENPNIIEDNIQFQIKRIILPVLDRNWREHIDDMAGFRQGIYLQSYAQTNPLEIYQKEGYIRFGKLTKKIIQEILITAMHTSLGVQRKPVEPPKDEDTLKGLSTNQDQSTTSKAKPVVKDKKFANVGPNDPCPCGSGMKFKFCHGIKR